MQFYVGYRYLTELSGGHNKFNMG